MQINRDVFFAAYRSAFGALTQEQVNGLEALLASIEHDDELDEDDLCPVAYMLATVKHECADTWQPITEYGARHYFDKYDPGTDIGRRLGNTEWGDGYKFRGRGYVQITGRANYARMSDVLSGTWNVNLIDWPEHALLVEVAYAIMSVGMHQGLFTGKTMAEFCDGRASDYQGARRIINGTDQAERIADYAMIFEGMLIAATDSEFEPAPMPTPIPAPPILVPPLPPKPPKPGFWRSVFGI